MRVTLCVRSKQPRVLLKLESSVQDKSADTFSHTRDSSNKNDIC